MHALVQVGCCNILTMTSVWSVVASQTISLTLITVWYLVVVLAISVLVLLSYAYQISISKLPVKLTCFWSCTASNSWLITQQPSTLYGCCSSGIVSQTLIFLRPLASTALVTI